MGKCSYCGVAEAVGGVFCHGCAEGRPHELTKSQYLLVLQAIRARIDRGVPIGLDDCNVIGYKHTHCAWGVCTDSVEVWDKAEYHIWPVEFRERGRVAPLDRPSKCPLDGRDGFDKYGCWGKCLAFRPAKGSELTRLRALWLYDIEIRKLVLEVGGG